MCVHTLLEIEVLDCNVIPLILKITIPEEFSSKLNQLEGEDVLLNNDWLR